MPVGRYQLFKFSVASEAVLPDNHLCPPLPFPPCVLERVMGIVFACRALPNSVDRALVTLDRIHMFTNVSPQVCLLDPGFLIQEENTLSRSPPTVIDCQVCQAGR